MGVHRPYTAATAVPAVHTLGGLQEVCLPYGDSTLLAQSPDDTRDCETRDLEHRLDMSDLNRNATTMRATRKGGKEEDLRFLVLIQKYKVVAVIM